MKKVGIVKDEVFLNHFSEYPHPENPERLLAIYEMIDKEELFKDLVIIKTRKASIEVIELIHTPEHIKTIEETAKQEFSQLDGDTYASNQTFETALLAAGSTIDCVEKVCKGKLDSAFALVRPPGHHAEKYRAMGFCIFNNIAIAAQYALRKLNLKKVAIVDFDLHHGNGTQHSFYDTDEVLYISTHQFPYYPGTGSIDEIGVGKGEGFTVNIPLPAGFGDVEYIKIFKEIINPILSQYRPQLILVSAGFDVYENDPLGGMEISKDGFYAIGNVLRNVSEKICHGKIVYVLEGGYSPTGLKEGTFSILRALIEEEPKNKIEETEKPPSQSSLLIIERIKDNFKNYWDF